MLSIGGEGKFRSITGNWHINTESMTTLLPAAAACAEAPVSPPGPTGLRSERGTAATGGLGSGILGAIAGGILGTGPTICGG